MSALLAVAGLAGVLAAPAGRLLADAPPAGPVVLLVALTLAFACAESAQLPVELRRHVYTLSPAGIVLLVGVLILDVRAVVLARVVGAVVVLVWNRRPASISVCALGSYTFETALVGLVLHLGSAPGASLTLAVAASCCVVAVLVDLVMSRLALLTTGRVAPAGPVEPRWPGIRSVLRHGADALGPPALLAAIGAVTALTVTTLLEDGLLGAMLAGCLGLAGLLGRREFMAARHRHRSLALVHEVVGGGRAGTTMGELGEVLLTRTAAVLDAGTVELHVQWADGAHLFRVDDAGFQTSPTEVDGPGDWLVSRVMTTGEPIVIARGTRDRGLRAWLTGRGVGDAVVVPLTGGDAPGVLIVAGRPATVPTFSAGDVALLHTLARHLAVALHEIHLVEQLRHDVTHDPLTGLSNRRELTERIEESLADAGPGSVPAVLMLDLDRFKEVNEALGHRIGDDLLLDVGHRITDLVPADAVVARVGSDEFAILLPRRSVNAEGAAVRLAGTILAALGSPITLEGAVVRTQGRIGVAIGRPGIAGADLLRHADTAMYAAKSGEDRVVVHSSGLDRGRAEQITLLADLHQALERDEFELRYQPQMDLQTDRIVSVEALVRWRHPRRGLIGPDLFIPLAESSGLIDAITHQVLGKALRQAKIWRDTGLDLTVAVNLSAHTVNNADLVDVVAAALEEVGLPADRLILEITETSVMGDPGRTVPLLQKLADLGVTLSLDDFGTGYSSLSYLQKLPVSEVKIDRSFVTGMAGGSEAHASAVLVRSILTLGGNLGLRVIAEGVENAEVLELLRPLGCDLAQGYHIARPLAAAELGRMVSSLESARSENLALRAVG